MKATPQKPEQTNERKIRILPPHIVNRIAAGEVVERPASVVKELVENALDAGATRVDIMAGAAGRTIRVADNGCGMAPEDAALAFYNHATSKIREEGDLDRIETLGFRGEALASIGSISRLTCLTRTADAMKGTRVSLDERGEPVLAEAGCAPGTILEISDLFYNTPARLKFLKRPATELGHIEETVQCLALSHPEVQFSLTINDRQVLKTSGSGELRRCMEEVFNLKRENIRLLPIAAEDAEAGFSLAGFASEPGVMRTSKRWMMTYVNSRYVRCGILQKAIEAAYESLLPHDKYPLCVLFVNMRTDEVDVNVHPAKREVRYAAANSVFGFVRTGIREAMASQGITFEPRPDFNPAGTWAPGGSFPQSGFTQAPVFPGHSHTPVFRPGADMPAWRAGGDGPGYPDSPSIQAAMQFYQPDAASGSGQDGISPDNEGPGQFKVIGQLFNTYILLETVQGLMVVDQHIASERTFFESLTLNLTGGEPAIQRLVTAQPIGASPIQRELLLRCQEDFARLGFLYAVDDTSVQLTGYPLIYAGRDRMFESGGLFENLLAQLEETGEMKPDLDHMIATLSCHSAVRAGDTLTFPEMHAVITQWLACRLPWTCPHGRPIAHTISKAELNHFFHRPSLPVNAV